MRRDGDGRAFGAATGQRSSRRTHTLRCVRAPRPTPHAARATHGTRHPQVGSAFLQAGLRPKERVGVLGANCPEWMLAMQVRIGVCGCVCVCRWSRALGTASCNRWRA